MFAYLSGILAAAEGTVAIVECGGVGYQCSISQSTLRRLPRTGEKVKLYTYFHIREGAVDLIGFADPEEKSCFTMMLAVSGVGPKAALSILSEVTPSEFATAVVTGDVKRLTRAQGVGAKLASRIVLELKDKVTNDQLAAEFTGEKPVAGRNDNAAEEAIKALVVLGYSRTEAKSAVSAVPAEVQSVEEIIRFSLKNLMM